MSRLKEDVDEYLRAIYYDPRKPSSYYSAAKIWSHIKTRADRPSDLDYAGVKQWLTEQTTHSIHSTPKTNFQTEKIIVEAMDDQWDGDILQLADLAGYNRGYKYLLLCIDLFSRYLWCRALKSKTATETSRAFQDILDQGRQCDTFRTDQGNEFLGAPFQRVLKENNVSHMIAYGPHKAAYAERVNQTIEGRLYKYFYEKQSFNYIDILNDVIFSYNHTIHSSIGMAPADVTPDNSRQLYERIYIPILNKRARQTVTYAFDVGDLVRLSRAKTPFKRGYQEQWTEEIFKICNRIPSHPPRYKVKDLADEIIKGSFYEPELQRVPLTNDPADIQYKIERVISTKKVGRQKLSLVKWYGYSAKFNSYVPTSQIQDYKR
ncbi:DDE-type integrase/transposase/recombinase [bacterium]|nr:DDE-type integrase/transposase/recombinase [bacterium]